MSTPHKRKISSSSTPTSKKKTGKDNSDGLKDEVPRRRRKVSRQSTNSDDDESDAERAIMFGIGGSIEEGPSSLNQRSSVRSRKKQLALLHQEMEVAQYARTKAGQLRRKVPRYDAKLRTEKRQALESQDKVDLEDEADALHARLRGSKAAVEEDVIQASQVFLPPNEEDTDVSDEDQIEGDSSRALVGKATDGLFGEDAADIEEAEEEIEFEENDNDGGNVNLEEDYFGGDGDGHDLQQSVNFESSVGSRNDVSRTEKKSSTEKGKKQSRRRAAARKKKLYRLRNFRSHRMAQRHGEALGAMVRGHSKLAIDKLKQVAKDAPSAPQIYSSLGMVYEDMLRGSQRQSKCVWQNLHVDKNRTDVDKEAVDNLTAEAFLTEQIDIAKKAYGAYHVAAILCKRDYSLWVRAADMALEIADLHGEVICLPHVDEHVSEYHGNEKMRWVGEAKNDYQTADQLKPPGIDVPAKLAAILLDLGYISEALTLMTDLKNRPSSVKGQRSDFESSYKAWALYADLMLKVGYECVRWNSGDQSNDNYMVRRWLRKWSKTFDWRERRLHSLARALEAAAGTGCCAPLLAWLQQKLKIGKKENNTENEHATRDQDGELINKRFQNELENFDRTTADLGLDQGSAAEKEREKARKVLVEKLKDQSEISAETVDPSEDVWAMKLTDELPLRASAKTVCSIASDLMRLLLESQECEGCRLVGEAVSSYMKTRAAMREKRLNAREQFLDNQTRPTNIFAFQKTSYDDVDEEESTDNDEPISDEDDLDGAEGAAITESFRKGVLPPDILSMYALSLAGLGGRDFLASKCLESLSSIEQEPWSWMDHNKEPASTQWDAFRVANSGQLRKIQAFAFVAGIFHSLKKEKNFGVILVKLFEGFEAEILGSGIVKRLSEKPSFRCPLCDFKIGLVVSTFAALIRYRMYHVRSSSSAKVDSQCILLLLRSLQALSSTLPSFWMLNEDKALSSLRMSVLSTVAEAFDLLAREVASRELDPDELNRSFGVWLTLLCAHEPMDLFSSVGSDLEASFQELPLDSQWQSADQYRISLRCFNLAVARNVSYFSGWEEREFSGSPHQLRRRSGPAFYGVTTADGFVAGYLSPPIVAELREQWEMLASSGKVVPSAALGSKFVVLGSNLFYSELERRIVDFEKESQVATHGEDDALSILLSFSRLSVSLVRVSPNGLLNALSVILPLTQFCLNEQIWNSRVGCEAASRSPQEWQGLVTGTNKDGVQPPSRRIGYIRPAKKADVVKPDRRASTRNWFSIENSVDPLSNLIVISKSRLAERWKEIASTSLCPERSPAESMRKLHNSVQRLRKSFTEEAVMRASIHVAAAMVELAMHPVCENGFLCLQHAALFAGQGSKDGSNDVYFKAPLPERENCSPHEAILVLGRADCLQSINFFREAAFLCGFVTSVCALQRQIGRGKLDRMWSIVSLAAYNTSVMIRYATLKLPQDQEKKVFECWDTSIKAELCLGRQEYLSYREEKDSETMLSHEAELKFSNQTEVQPLDCDEIRLVENRAESVEIVEV